MDTVTSTFVLSIRQAVRDSVYRKKRMPVSMMSQVRAAVHWPVCEVLYYALEEELDVL